MKMGKGTSIGLSLAALLGHSIATTDIASAQGKYEPIRFGQKGEYTYEPSQTPPSDPTIGRELEQRLGQVCGRYHINTQNGEIELWGISDNGAFFYITLDKHKEFLVLQETFIGLGFDGLDNSIILSNNLDIIYDSARFNGEHITLGDNRFYEGPGIIKPPEELSERELLMQKAHQLYTRYAKFLNLSEFVIRTKEIWESIRPSRQQLKTIERLLQK